MRGVLALAGAVLLGLPGIVSSETLSHTVGQVTMLADLTQSFPGGVIVARVGSRAPLGAVWAILDGRRSALYESAGGPRALVPVPVDREAGPTPLGFEIMARLGTQRVPMDVVIHPRSYAPRSVAILDTRRHLASLDSATHDSRQLLELVRTESPLARWGTGLHPPVGEAPDAASFGAPQTYVGGISNLEHLVDGAFGEYHRGLDFPLPVGTVVQAPGAGLVLFAGPMTVPGETVVIDHGQGVVSVVSHLSRVEVREGDTLDARATLGLSGESGAAMGPLVEWRVYVHGIAVDPRVMAEIGR